MSDRDAELRLAFELGDTVKYQQAWDKLTDHADFLASEMFSSPSLMAGKEDAIEKAMDRVGDGLTPDSIKYIDYPWAYAETTIYNSLCTSLEAYKKSSVKIREVGLKTRVRKRGKAINTVQDQLAQIDSLFIDSETWSQGIGWQIFEIIGKGISPKKEDDSYLLYYEHKYIEKLNELLKYKWWWDEWTWRGEIKSERKRTMQSFGSYKEIAKEARLRWKEYTSKRWNTYKLTTALIDNIPRPTERFIMEAYLAGLKQVEITKLIHSSKPVRKQYVSRIVKKYLKEWEWDESDIHKAKTILLTQRLATWYKHFIISNLPKSGNGYKSKLDPTYDIQSYHKEALYGKVVNSMETKAYLGDLEKSPDNINSLTSICGVLCEKWYPTLFSQETTQYIIEEEMEEAAEKEPEPPYTVIG